MSFSSIGCRFCLRSIQSHEKMALIDEEVKSQFLSLTLIELELTDGLSKVVCEVCLRSVQLATAVKLQFVENQKKLHSVIESAQIGAKTSGIKIHDIKGSDDLVPDFTITPAVPVVSEIKRIVKKRKITPKRPENDNNLSMEPEIDIKEEQFSNNEIQFNNHFFNQFNNSDIKPFNMTNDSDDQSGYLDPMDIKNNDPCTSATKRKKILIKPMVTVDKPFPCVYCGKYYNKRHMSRHINVEHKKIKFQCIIPDCPSAYSRKEKLRLHIQTKHIDCSQEEYAELLERVRTLSPIYENVSHVHIDQPKYKFYCVVPGCEMNFLRKNKLKSHIAESHTNLSAEEIAEVMTKFEALEPVYEMHGTTIKIEDPEKGIFNETVLT